MKHQPIDQARTKLLEQVLDLIEAAKLLRDYATTPGNIWLANNELSKATQMLSEIQATLEEIKVQDGLSGGPGGR